MSKLRLYGDTSGYIDVAAPATADNSTLDLSRVVKEDASGNVGIGTDSPTKPLHIYGNTSNNHQIRLQNDFGSGADWTLNAYGANGTLYIGNNLDRLLIDSSGRVRMPYQPSFALNVLGGQTYGTGWRRITLTGHDSTFIQGGLALSDSNTRITVPSSGIYHLEANVTYSVGNQNTDGTLCFRKNGISLLMGGSNAQTDANHGSITISHLVSLSASDYVEVWGYHSPNNMTTRDTNFAGYFSGHLVG